MDEDSGSLSTKRLRRTTGTGAKLSSCSTTKGRTKAKAKKKRTSKIDLDRVRNDNVSHLISNENNQNYNKQSKMKLKSTSNLVSLKLNRPEVHKIIKYINEENQREVKVKTHSPAYTRQRKPPKPRGRIELQVYLDKPTKARTYCGNDLSDNLKSDFEVSWSSQSINQSQLSNFIQENTQDANVNLQTKVMNSMLSNSLFQSLMSSVGFPFFEISVFDFFM